MTLPGKTASRFLLAAARVVLTDAEFTNGYIPDFRGNKVGRVPISQESVDKLRGFESILLSFNILLYSFSFRRSSNALWLQRGRYE